MDVEKINKTIEDLSYEMEATSIRLSCALTVIGDLVEYMLMTEEIAKVLAEKEVDMGKFGITFNEVGEDQIQVIYQGPTDEDIAEIRKHLKGLH